MGNHRLQFLPAPSSIIAPESLHPRTKGTWEYATRKAIAVSGIYNEANLQDLRDHIMFPLEKSSVLNNVAMGMTGKNIQGKGISINQFLDSEVLESLANNTWNHFWEKFLTFGTASAGVLGIILIARLIKMLIDTILHGITVEFSNTITNALWRKETKKAEAL
ncbi:hypothetical protein TSAR_008252 [Trichomalopsis sarcophagae]|uniref:Uncharacterized protein n=1 Tax=Trichomalopsis sarcophagae TaxID=543379 RepID=A0A232EDN9_9HYME|nr:hypothetical protein TSAR_008252 [Trichomalopsis sarcophagae]